MGGVTSGGCGAGVGGWWDNAAVVVAGFDRSTESPAALFWGCACWTMIRTVSSQGVASVGGRLRSSRQWATGAAFGVWRSGAQFAKFGGLVLVVRDVVSLSDGGRWCALVGLLCPGFSSAEVHIALVAQGVAVRSASVRHAFGDRMPDGSPSYAGGSGVVTEHARSRASTLASNWLWRRRRVAVGSH